MCVGVVNKQSKKLEASKAMSKGKRAVPSYIVSSRNENGPKLGVSGDSLKIPRISSANSRRSDSETTGTRAHHAVQILSPRSQANFDALRSVVSRGSENAVFQHDGGDIPAWKKRQLSRQRSIGLATKAIKKAKSRKKKKGKKKKKGRTKKKLSQAQMKKMEEAKKAEEEERQERIRQKKEALEAQRYQADRARRAIAHQREYRRRVRQGKAQRSWRTLKNSYRLTQFETHKKVIQRAFVCVRESEARWLKDNQSGAVAMLTQFAEKYRKIYPELDVVLNKAHGRSLKMRYTMLELCLLNMLETDEEKQESTQIGKAVPRVMAPSKGVVKHQKYVEVTDHGGPVEVLRKEDFTLHVVDHHNDLVKMREELMHHAASEVGELWNKHHEEKRKLGKMRRSSVQIAEQAMGIQDALFSHTDKLIAWHDDYSKNRSKIHSEADQSYELYKQQVQNINKKFEKKESFGAPRGFW